MRTASKKIAGILTSGGDAPGLNAAIRALCLTGKKYGIKFIGIRNGYQGLINNDTFSLDDYDVDSLYNQGGTFLGTSRVKPFKNPEPDPKTGLLPIEAIKETIRKNKIDVLVCLGGNGTNSTAYQLSQEGINVIGLPKTIDNDLFGSDETFGFNSAINVAVNGLESIKTTARSHSRIMVVEIMGHKVGWIALHSGIAANADVILVPEIPYDASRIAEYIKEKKAKGQNSFIIACSEGAMNIQESVLTKKEFKKLRAKETESIAFRVAKELEEKTGIESRASVIGYLQRGGNPSPYDILLATKIGSKAAEFISEEKYGQLVALQNGKIVGVPLEDVAFKIKSINADNEYVKIARNLGINFGD